MVKEKLLKVILNKWVVFAACIIGCAYITVYGFLKDPLHYTASMIGLDYPGLFILWGILSSIALALNINYMYKRYSVKNKFGYACMLLGSLCIMTTVFIPSTEIMSVQLVFHWGTALLFAVFFAASIILFLISARKLHRNFFITLIIFSATLVLMIILLILFNKNGVIESIPMWAAYLLLFLANFTKLYGVKG